MKISASLYANGQEKKLDRLVQELDRHHIDMLHIDCVDGADAFADIKKIRSVSRTPIDLHIISSQPEIYFDQIARWQIDYVSFQYENLQQLPQLPQLPHTRFGLSFVSETPTDIFEKVKDRYSFALMMATAPGVSGGIFDKKNFQKIIAFQHQFPKTQIHVDGGIDNRIAFILRLLGVHTIVSGSYLVNHPSIGAGILSFMRMPEDGKNTGYQIADFATPLSFLPVIQESEVSFKTVLEKIEHYGQGFVLITDSMGKLTGVVSNADVRRGLLKNLKDISQIKPDDIINRNPVFIREDAGLNEMTHLLNNLSFIVLFLPVVDAHKKLKGAVLLNRLTRV